MKNIIVKSLILFLSCGIVLSSCKKDDDPVDVETPVELAFIGSNSCEECHTDKYNDWKASGHPFKFNVVENGVAPEYPVEAFNYIDSWMTNLVDGSHSWDDVAGVIGGYGWKSRFVGQDGVIIGTASSQYATAGLGHNQFNFFGGEDHGWVDYETGTENKLYNYGCFKCHTTGGSTEGTWLEGVDGLGTFTEQGIGCESCHGPGSQHVANPSKSNIDLVYEFAHEGNDGLTINGSLVTPNENGNDVNFLCGTCHNRGYSNVIDSKGGFVKHHEQWDELVSTKHGSSAGLSCSTCHDPHKRTIWDGDAIIKNCSECHSSAAATVNHTASASCVDCHMPYAAKSGTKRGESGFEGDVRSHLMKIIVNDEDMFTEDGSAVRDDATRPAALSVAYSCLGCHNRSSSDAIPDKTLEDAINEAAGMHSGSLAN